MSHRAGRFLFACVALCLILVLLTPPLLGWASAGPAAAVLGITPISWGVIGLDSNNVNAGPNVYMIGARVCNTGDAAATNLVSAFVWDSANANINLRPGSAGTLALSTLAAGDCALFNYEVEITRIAAAYDTARGYHITVAADGLAEISTPTPRELYVEHLVSQNRNTIASITGPTSVNLGGTYTYVVTGSTAPGGYEQLMDSTPFSNTLFRILSIAVTYTQPVGATNDKEYADACGWDAVPTSPTYRSCIGPVNYAGGKAGGTMVTTYTVLVTGVGTTTLSPVIYDFSGSSYHYNSDYGFSIVVVSEPAATETPTSTATSAPTDTPTSTSTATSIPTETPTSTATSAPTDTPTSTSTATSMPTDTATPTETPPPAGVVVTSVGSQAPGGSLGGAWILGAVLAVTGLLLLAMRRTVRR